jgi:hypothetical protein
MPKVHLYDTCLGGLRQSIEEEASEEVLEGFLLHFYEGPELYQQ